MGLNLGRLGVALARGRGAYQQGRVRREQMDFDNERELAREQLNEAFRRDQLDARREQNEGMAQSRRDVLEQQRLAAEAQRTQAAALQAERLAAQRELQRARAEDQANMVRLSASLRPAPAAAPGWEVRETPEGLVRVNARTGELAPLAGQDGQQLQGTTRATTTEGERKAAALLNQARNAYGALKTYQPSVRAQQLSRVPVVGNILAGSADPEGQAAQQAGFQFADAYLRFVSGAAVPEQEVRRYMATFLPQPGDQPATIQRKKEAQKAILESLEMGAGRLAQPRGASAPPRQQQTRRPMSAIVGQVRQ